MEWLELESEYVWVYLLVYLAVLFFLKKIKTNDDTTSGLLYSPIMCAGKYTCYSSNTQRKESIEGLRHGVQDGSLHHAKNRTRFPDLEAGSVFFI